MKAEWFSDKSPGRLVPTTAHDLVRKGPSPATQPVRGLAFVPDDLPPKLDWQSLLGAITMPLLRAERAIATLNGRGSRLDNADLLLAPFIRREARLSSRIEDTIATPKELVLLEAGQAASRDDPQEVFNYMRAMRLGLSSELPIAHRLLNDMHRVLLESGRGTRARPGAYRTLQNYIGRERAGFKNSRFVPPPPGDTLLRCMKSLESFINMPPGHIPELITIAIAHYQFECIHPYEDGNGRLGRLIIPLSLCRYGLLAKPYIYVSAYFDANREAYCDLLLRVSTEGAWQEWIEFFLDAVASQAVDAASRVDRILELWRNYAARVTAKRTSSLQRKLIDCLFESPAITVSQAQSMLKLSNTAARKHIQSLVDLDILEEGPTVGRTVYYVASEILQVTDDGE